MKWIVAAAAFLLTLQPWSAGFATSVCGDAYSACMRRCIELAGIRQTQPERCMLTCVQSRTHCAALTRSLPAEPAITLPKPAPAAAKQQAPITAAKPADRLPDSNGEPAPTFSWNKPQAAAPSFFKLPSLPASSAAPDIPLH